jgi:hypothetical protein
MGRVFTGCRKASGRSVTLVTLRRPKGDLWLGAGDPRLAKAVELRKAALANRVSEEKKKGRARARPA